MKLPKFCPHCKSALESALHGGRDRLACCNDDCDFIFWGNPTPVVAAVIELGSDVVLVRNHGWPEKWFGLVTGFLERGETPEEGILREIDEELNLHGEIESFIGLYPFEQMNELVIAYYVKATGEVEIGDEIEEFKLIPREKLRPWSFGTGKAVRDWIERNVKSDPQ